MLFFQDTNIFTVAQRTNIEVVKTAGASHTNTETKAGRVAGKSLFSATLPALSQCSIFSVINGEARIFL